MIYGDFSLCRKLIDSALALSLPNNKIEDFFPREVFRMQRYKKRI